MKSPESAPMEKKPDKPYRRLSKGLFVSALAAAALFASSKDSDSGQLTSFPPKKETTPKIDNKASIVTWNMHNEAPTKVDDLKAIDREYAIDAFLLTEVSKNDASVLSKAFPAKHVEFVMADRDEKSEQGGFGNSIITDLSQENVTSRTLEGRSPAEGLIASIGRGSISLAAAKNHESRSAIAATIQIDTKDGYKNVRLVSGHLSPYPDIRIPQFEEFHEFADAQRENYDAVIVGGDMNASRKEMFDFQKDGWIIPQTGPTFIDGKSTLDYFAYAPGNTLGLDHTKVLKDYATDHHPVLLESRAAK